MNKIDCVKDDNISSKKIKLNNSKSKSDETSGASTEGKKSKLNENTKNEDCLVSTNDRLTGQCLLEEFKVTAKCLLENFPVCEDNKLTVKFA